MGDVAKARLISKLVTASCTIAPFAYLASNCASLHPSSVIHQSIHHCNERRCLVTANSPSFPQSLQLGARQPAGLSAPVRCHGVQLVKGRRYKEVAQINGTCFTAAHAIGRVSRRQIQTTVSQRLRQN